MKNLILTVASNYEINQIEHFFSSLSSSGFNDNVVLFSNNVRELKKLLAKYDFVQNVDFSFEYPFLSSSYEKPDQKFDKNYHVVRLRFILYYYYLMSLEEKPGKIMLTDLRDVVFQKDPFDYKYKEGLCVFGEGEMKISECDIHKDWILSQFDDNVFNSLKTSNIVNSGVTIGDFEEIINYLEIMLEFLNKGNTSGFDDQGLHNYIIHKKLINSNFYQTWFGPVAITRPWANIRMTSDKVINQDGTIINILHQFDRHKIIRDLYEY